MSFDELYDGTFTAVGAGAKETGGVGRASFFFPPPARRAKSLLITNEERERMRIKQLETQNTIVQQG